MIGTLGSWVALVAGLVGLEKALVGIWASSLAVAVVEGTVGSIGLCDPGIRDIRCGRIDGHQLWSYFCVHLEQKVGREQLGAYVSTLDIYGTGLSD